LDEAPQLFADALALATTLGDESLQALIRVNMAELESEMGQHARALELVKPIETESHRHFALYWLVNGGAYRIALGDIAGARIAAHKALRLARGVNVAEATFAMQHLAIVAALHGDARRGARLRGYVDASYRIVNYELQGTDRRTFDILMTALHEKLSDAEIESLAAEGAQLSEDQAGAEALNVDLVVATQSPVSADRDIDLAYSE
jgi:hypothetical protein